MTPLFLPSTLLIILSLPLFRLLPRSLGTPLLSLTALLIAALLNLYGALALLIVTLLTYFTGKLLTERPARAGQIKLIFAAALAVLWCICTGFHIYHSLLVGPGSWYLPSGLPVSQLAAFTGKVAIFYGLTFYCGRAIFYVADVHAGAVKAEQNFWRLSLYLNFVPWLVCGPYLAVKPFFQELDKQPQALRPGVLKEALWHLAVGFFLKFSLADSLNLLITLTLDQTVLNVLGGIPLIAAAVFYVSSLFIDLLSYHYMAVGLAALYGIDLPLRLGLPWGDGSGAGLLKAWFPTWTERLGKFGRPLNKAAAEKGMTEKSSLRLKLRRAGMFILFSCFLFSLRCLPKGLLLSYVKGFARPGLPHLRTLFSSIKSIFLTDYSVCLFHFLVFIMMLFCSALLTLFLLAKQRQKKRLSGCVAEVCPKRFPLFKTGLLFIWSLLSAWLYIATTGYPLSFYFDHF